ncbi:MAG: hypothetical protein FJ298_15765, partial [Planctomycetes bacterium]|nr:hypothetical protein [Planctomycetota bacterium]
MSSHSPQSGGSAPSLTLVVRPPEGAEHEVFVLHGLTLGRAASNAICIPHPDVDAIHARVLRTGGEFRLQAESGSRILLSDGSFADSVLLEAGLELRFGTTVVRCARAVVRGADASRSWLEVCCICGTEIPASDMAELRCRGCGAELFLEDRSGFRGWLPRKLGRYDVRRFIARGGMGIVLRGLDREHDSPVALKLPHAELARDARWQRRFESEVRALRSFVHPNLVRLEDHGSEGDLRWLAMEWVDGSSLAALLDSARAAARPFPLAQVHAWLAQLVAGLRVLHRAGIAHRDLKPANLLLRSDGTLKVADFGLAKELEDQGTLMTLTGTVAGTGPYMSPEQLAGERLTPASDLFALGVIWHELLVFKRPGRTLRVREQRPDVPPQWIAAIEQLLDDEPPRRPSLDQLRRVFDADDFAAPNPAIPPFAGTAPPLPEPPEAHPAPAAAPTASATPLTPPPSHAPESARVSAKTAGGTADGAASASASKPAPARAPQAAPPRAESGRLGPRLAAIVLLALAGVLGLVFMQSQDDAPQPLAAVPLAPDARLPWAEVLERKPDAAVVTDAKLRGEIEQTGLPWRVKDKGTGIELLLVPPGKYQRGASAGDGDAQADENPAHEVTLTQPFYLGRYEVTQAQWQAAMGSNPSTKSKDPQAPVETVSHDDIANFNQKTGLRLPTEAEWEYACRAGSTAARHGELDAIAWHVDNSGRTTHPVGRKRANA